MVIVVSVTKFLDGIFDENLNKQQVEFSESEI